MLRIIDTPGLGSQNGDVGVVQPMWTDEQQTIITSPMGNQVVYAAPGSGKTAVLTQHIASVIENKQAAPAEIMAVTFTKQAALEMRTRLGTRTSLSFRQAETVRIGTFHAQVFQWVLRHTPDVPVILRQTEQLQFLSAAMKAAGWQGGHRPHAILSVLSAVKSTWPHRPLPDHLHRIIALYETLKRRNGRWDFDDILSYWCQLSDDGRVLSVPKTRYILVDEFQDTNQIQWYVLQRLVEISGCHLFAVGDDDQAIYGFRGADPAWLIQFPRRMERSTVHYLSRNFRSDIRIVESAGQLIQHNRHRTAKQMVPQSQRLGDCVVIVHHDTAGEYQWIQRRVAYLSAQRDLYTIGILARTRVELARLHAQAGAFLNNGEGVSVEFRTFHDAKGKEWDEVHILDVVEKNPFLAEWSEDSAFLEEERRLFYVAMTRARHSLLLHWPRHIDGRRTQRSRFVAEAGLAGECMDAKDVRVEAGKPTVQYSAGVPVRR